MKSQRFTAIFGVLLVASGLAPRAHAETGAAEALFREGREATRRGEHANACALFAESERLEPAVGTELNLALCEERIGHLLRAWQFFRLSLDRLPAGDDRLLMAQRHLSDIDERIPRVTLKAKVPLPVGTVIELGQTRLTPSSLGVAIPVELGELGEVVLVVRAPRHENRLYQLVLSERERQTLSIEPGPSSVAGPGPSARTAEAAARPAVSNHDSSKLLGVLGLGLGGAALAVSGASGLAVLSAKQEMEDECNADQACTARGMDAAERGSKFSTIATVSFAVGVVAAGAGTWFLLSSSPKPEPGRVSLRVGPANASLQAQF